MPEREEEEQEVENLFEKILKENFPNLVKETGTQINGMDQKEERNIQPEKKKQEFKKNEERLRNLPDIFKCSNIRIIGVPEGEEEEQEIENLFEKILKENFLNLAKEIDIQVQEVQRIPNKLDPRRNTPKHIIIK